MRHFSIIEIWVVEGGLNFSSKLSKIKIVASHAVVLMVGHITLFST